MNIRSILTISCLLTSAAIAADAPKTPKIPSDSIAKKKDLLFADDFKDVTHDAKCHRVVDTFVFEKGALKGTQTRDKNIPAANKTKTGEHLSTTSLNFINPLRRQQQVLPQIGKCLSHEVN